MINMRMTDENRMLINITVTESMIAMGNGTVMTATETPITETRTAGHLPKGCHPYKIGGHTIRDTELVTSLDNC